MPEGPRAAGRDSGATLIQLFTLLIYVAGPSWFWGPGMNTSVRPAVCVSHHLSTFVSVSLGSSVSCRQMCFLSRVAQVKQRKDGKHSLQDSSEGLILSDRWNPDSSVILTSYKYQGCVSCCSDSSKRTQGLSGSLHLWFWVLASKKTFG